MLLYSQMTYSFLTAVAVFLAYIIPAYCMSGLKGEDDNLTFTVYLGYMLFYLFTVRVLAMAMAYTFDSRHLASAVTGLVMTFVIMCSGYTVHFLDLSIVLFWFQWVSPMRWIMEQIDTWDLAGRDPENIRIPRETFTCSQNLPVTTQSSVIIFKPPCSFRNGLEALDFFGYNSGWPLYVPTLVTFGFGLFWLGWILVFFTGKRQQQKKSRKRVQELWIR